MTTRRLVVMRHAKAEQLAANDHARNLSRRGVRDARQAGAWLKREEYVPTFALVSSAARTTGTLDALAEGMGEEPEANITRDMYGADAEEAIELINEIADKHEIVIVIGHNPTMADLAFTLQAEAQDEWPPHLQTAGLVVLEFDGSWADLKPHSAELIEWEVSRG
jgi:phosphohistidine phosphatase